MMYSSDLDIAMEAALHAGAEILKIYNDPAADFEIECKADHSPLTIADRRANEVIMRYLTHTVHPIISEENRNMDYAVRKTWKRVWVVDPLDGTKEFIKRNGEFTVNIALVEEGRPVLGAVYIPVRGVLYYGSEGDGAYRVEEAMWQNGEGVEALKKRAERLPLRREDGKFVAVASRSHLSPETAAFIERMRQEHGEVEMISVGSSIKICLVAEGTADVYPRFAPTMEWDTAAGHAVVRAAGREIYREDGVTPLRYNKEDLLNPWFIVK